MNHLRFFRRDRSQSALNAVAALEPDSQNQPQRIPAKNLIANCINRRLWILLSLLLLCHPTLAFAADEQPGTPPEQPTQPAITGTVTAAEERAGLVVNPKNRQESLDFFKTYYETAVPDHNWSGDPANCRAGEPSAAYRSAIVQRINYFRAMAGVPADIVLIGDYNQKAQQAALIMSANRQLSHAPPSNWRCHTADGAAAAGKSNLYLGVFGPAAIDGYIHDAGGNNAAVGHRRWILYPQTRYMGTGDVPETAEHRAANALWVFDDHTWDARPATRDGFVAWPPAGYVPHQLIYPRWSFSYPGADFAGATVTMRQNDGSLPIAQEPIATGFGENTLVWIPTVVGAAQVWEKPAADTSYQVSIENVLVDGAARTFSYTITSFDPEDRGPIPVLDKKVYLPIATR